ncbi:MAG: hypothetical protein AB9897_00710 [Anaerolineaceae bacterium]
MLEALMKFGSFRVDRFIRPEHSGNEFGFYICAHAGAADHYCADAKHQLYYGLAQIQAHGELKNLAGIYIDINDLKNLRRPAYLQLKDDLNEGRFQRVLVLDNRAVFGCVAAEKDLMKVAQRIHRFELFTYHEGVPAILAFSDRSLSGISGGSAI